MIDERKFDINKEKIPCPACGKENIYANAICENCGARLGEQKEKIQNILDMVEFTFTGQYKKGDKIQQWCDKLEDYFKEGKDEPEKEIQLVEEPLNKLLKEKGYIAVYNILEGNKQLKESIFKKTRHAVCADFITALAQNGFIKEASSYIEIMVENKLEAKNFKKLVVELGILTSQKKIDGKIAPFLMKIAENIGADYGAVLALVLLDFDTTYGGNVKKKAERLMFSYEKALPLLEEGQYQSCDLEAFGRLLRELGNLGEDLLADSWEEMFDIAAENQDEALGQMLVEFSEEYFKNQGIDKAHKFLSENDYLKSSIFETFETVASSFIVETYKNCPSETFAKYFAMALNNEKFMNCEKKTKPFFGELYKADGFEFVSQLALKKALAQLPVDIEQWLDFEKPEAVKEPKKVKKQEAVKEAKKPAKLKKQQEKAKEPEKSEEILSEEALSDEDLMLEAMICKYLDFDTNIPYDGCLEDTQDEDDIFGEIFYGMDAKKKADLGIDGLMEEWLAYKGVDPYNYKEAMEYLKYCGDEEVEDEFAYVYYDLTDLDKRKMGIEGPLYDWLVEQGVDPYDEELCKLFLKELYGLNRQEEESDPETYEAEAEGDIDVAADQEMDQELDQALEPEADQADYEFGSAPRYNFDVTINRDYGLSQYLTDCNYEQEYESEEDEDEENEFDFDLDLNLESNNNLDFEFELDNNLDSDLDFDYDSDFDREELLQAIEDAEDYAYLASIGASSTYDLDAEALREEEFIDDMMIARGVNPYDFDARKDFLLNPFGGGDDDW